jgi:hypothetical protein
MIFQINFYFSIITKIKIKTGKFGPGIPLSLTWGPAANLLLLLLLFVVVFHANTNNDTIIYMINKYQSHALVTAPQ